VTVLFEHACERLLPFATADWAHIWPSFVRDLSDLVSSLAPGVLLQETMAGIVPSLSVAPASPAVPTLPEVLISTAESSPSPSPSPSPSLPSPVALPSPTGTSGPTRASSFSWDRSPQSARGLDVSRASRPVRSLPTRTCSQRRQKCAIPKGRDPLDMSEPCLRCVHDKKICDWTREAVGASSVFFILPCCG
jgi:hypothetical protein